MNLWRDAKTGMRALRNSPGYAATAILTLALGIGATTATFSFCDGLLWKPLPLPRVESLAMITERDPESPAAGRDLTPADFDDIRRQSSAFTGLAAWDDNYANLVEPGGAPERIDTASVSANFFDVLSVAPARGRAFLPGEDQRGGELVVILGDDLWRRFGADPAIAGRLVHLNDRTYRVIGVMPPGFRFPKRAQLWTPLALDPSTAASRTSPEFVAMGRLKPGLAESDAAREIAAIGARLAQRYPATNQGRAFRVMGVQRFLMGEVRGRYIALLFGAVLFVLLIACANVANLQFARALGRMREVAVRAALGAGRGRLMAQLLTESVLLALAGGALGLLVASWGLDAWRASLPADAEKSLPGLAAIALDHRALLFALLAAVASGILSGLAPAWQWARPNLYDALKERGGSASGRARHRLRAALVAGEIALTVVLLTGAGLMIRGFGALTRSGAELDPASLLTLRLAVTDAKYSEDYQLADFYRRVLERVSAVPGVRAAAGATSTPYSDHVTTRLFTIEGRPPAPGHTPEAAFQAVSANYFETMRVPLIAGRRIEDRDTADAPRVAVVGRRLARQWWPGGESPLGRRIRIGDASRERPWATVVGVVGDEMFRVFDRAPHATLYVPYAQAPREKMDIGVRVSGDPARLVSSIAAAIHSVDPEQPVTDVRTVDAQIRDQALGLTYVAAMLGIFGVIGLVLSSIGVYGVMAYTVSEQTHEIGIRMALGAPRTTVLRTVFRRGFAATAVGLAAGLGVAFALARLMASLIWGVGAGDPVTFAAVPVALAAAASLAIYLPARRAISIDPMAALRHE